MNDCLTRDRLRLQDWLRRAERDLQDKIFNSPWPAKAEQAIAESRKRRLDRYHARPRPSFGQDLPINQKRADITAAIEANQVIVLCGETGSGKTTQLPKICLELGRGVAGMIGHTQPRRIAARTVAQRIADELGPGGTAAVGYKVRFNDRTTPNTYVKLMTDGILLAEIQHDRLLSAYDTIIIDEAHERSLNIDFLLGYLRQLLPKRPDLKIIITSATIDPERFSKQFNGCPIIEVSGRTFPVEVRYRPLQTEDEDEAERTQIDGILDAVTELQRDAAGDVLVFLPGEREIRETSEALIERFGTQMDVLPLYSRLSGDAQQRIFQVHSKPRIVLATNVAETSLTVPGIKYVIDPGTARISRYGARGKVQRLQIEPISRASADQRKGRCGRVSDGICIRLYAESDFAARPPFTEPELLRTNLAAVILQMKSLGLGEIDKFPFVEPPDARLVRDGYLTLHELGAVDEENRLTAMGRQLARLPVDPRIARMVAEAERENCLAEVLVIAAFMSAADPRERPPESAALADASHKQFVDENSDFLSILKLWEFWVEKHKNLGSSQLRKQCKANYLSYRRLREWADVHHQLRETVNELGWKADNNASFSRRARSPIVLPNGAHLPNNGEQARRLNGEFDNIHRALLSGLLSNIGNRNDRGGFTGPRSVQFVLHPSSSLFKAKPPWVMAAELTLTTKLYGRTVARIDPKWIERLAAHLVKRTYTDPTWNPARADVQAGEKVTLRGLVIVPHRTVSYGPIDPRTSREVFIAHALVDGEYRTNAEFFKHNVALVEHIKLLQTKARRQDVLAEPRRRFAFFDRVVPPSIYNGVLFERWRKLAEAENPRLLFLHETDVATDALADVRGDVYPDSIQAGLTTLPLSYVHDNGSEHDGITATIPLALLNQVPAAAFDWLVPGYRAAKIEEAIRSLPKPIRTQLVPVPTAAAEVAATLVRAGPSSARSPVDRGEDAPALTSFAPFWDVLADALGKRIGQTIPRSLFEPDKLPAYLRMNFRIVDDQGRTVATGRDLAGLRNQLGIAARDSFAQQPPTELNRDNLTTWAFDDLPERVEIHRGGAVYSGFPAIVDNGKSVSIRVLDSRPAAAIATRSGVRRLFMLQLDREITQLGRQWPDFDAMAMHYKPLGNAKELREQLISAAVDLASFGDTGGDVRTKAEFVERARDGWGKLWAASKQLHAVAKPSLASFHELSLALSADAPPLLLGSIVDMRRRLATLMPKNFLIAVPTAYRPHLPRYLAALSTRLRKLTHAGLARDLDVTAKMRPVLEAYAALQQRPLLRELPAVRAFRWRIEELHVSLFAQELKTPGPVSIERLLREIEAVEKSA